MELQITEAEIVETMQWTVDNILIPHFNTLGYEGQSLNATGEWLRELNVRAEGQSGVINGRKYTEQLVWGREPNQDQSHEAKAKWAYGMANYNEGFMKWLQVRGLVPYGMQVAYKIADRGTNIFQKGGTDLLEILSEPQNVKRITDHLQAQYTPRVTVYLERQIQEAFR